MANEITPHLTAEEYMDKGEYENELKQVIGDTKVAVLATVEPVTRKYCGACVRRVRCGETCLTSPEEPNLFYFVVVRRCTQKIFVR